jgi:hypothetical protein
MHKEGPTMQIRGIFEGTFESVWSMRVPEEDYKSYMESHPDFDKTDTDDITEMWNHFKSLGCYDEVDDTVDTNTTMTGIEL